MRHKQPEQVVIFAGGLGTRLRPITNTIPKPMIKFHGKPFLEYLVEQVKNQGIKKILLLLGYLPDIIQKHFQDGKKFGISIEYSVSEVENDTGTRLKKAKNKIDDIFYMMYCDNYCPLDFYVMYKSFTKNDLWGQLTVYGNKDKYTKDNIRIRDSIVEEYDKTRLMEKLSGVEIGYAIFKKHILDLIPEGNVNFEKTVYPKLVKSRKLGGFVTDHRYYSVSSHERLHLTKQFLLRPKAIILDRDGVLNEKAPKAQYVTNWDEYKWLPGARESLKLLKENGFTIIVVTNQAGIARGYMTEKDLLEIHKKMNDELKSHDAKIDAFYYCPHGWNDNCECRKPKPGMLFQAQRDFHLDLSKTYFIGDDERDKAAGDQAGCKSLLVDKDNSLSKLINNFL